MRASTLSTRALTIFIIVSLFLGMIPFASGASPPSGPVLADPWVHNSLITLNWTVPSNNGGASITGYQIYKGNASGSEELVAVVSGSTLTYTDGNVVNGRHYYYYVAAVNDAGPGQISDEKDAIPLSVPAAPTTLTALAGNGNITLSWVPPYETGGHSITWFRVFRSTSAGAEVFVTNVTSLSYLDSGLANGRTFYYKVSAVSDLGEGPRSIELSVVLPWYPGPVTNLTANGLNASVQLSWTAPSNSGGVVLSGYQVYRGTSTGVETLIATVSALSFTDPGLINGQIYYYKVNAVNSMGPGELSDEVNATPTCPPYSPVMLRATVGDQKVNLNWTDPPYVGGSPILGYKIYRGTTLGTDVVIANTTVPYYNDTLLTNGRTYYYRVSAVNAKGEGTRSAVVAAIPLAAPGAPTHIVLVPRDSIINITWSAPSVTGGGAILHYILYWSTASDGPWSTITTSTNLTNFTHSDLINGVGYYYRISAVTAGGEGPSTSIYSSTPARIPDAPSEPILQPGAGQMRIIWQMPSNGGDNISVFNIYRGTASGNEVLVNTTNGTEFTDVGLSNATRYYYMISAINGRGEGNMSSEVSAMTFSLPGIPEGLTAQGGDGNISLSWNMPQDTGEANISIYTVYRASGSDPTNLVAIANVTFTEYLDEGLVNGMTYIYQVSASNVIGEGELSVGSSAIPSTFAGGPENLTATAGNKTVTLNWSAPSHNGGSSIIGYNVYRGISPDALTLVASLGVVYTCTDEGLSNGTAYYYQITAVNQKGEGTASQQIMIRTLGPPSKPLYLSCSEQGSSIVLTWSAPAISGGAAISFYNIYRGTSPGTESLLASVNDNSFTDSGLPSGQTYYYTVTAVNAKGESERALEKMATTMFVPDAPNGLIVIAGNEKVTLNWSASASRDGTPILDYLIYRGDAPGTGTLLGAVTSTTFVDTNLTNGVTYYYSVSAKNISGEGPRSDEVVASPRTIPGAPTDLSAVAKDGQVTIRWKAPANGGANITKYTIYWAKDPTIPIGLWSTVQSNSTSYVMSGLVNNQAYYFKVSATNIAGEGPLSSIASAKPIALLDPPLNLHAEAGDSKITLTWEPPGGLMSSISGYIIYRSNSSGSMEYLTYSANTTFVDTMVENGQTYHYQVSTMSLNGEGLASQAVTASPSASSSTSTLFDSNEFKISMVIAGISIFSFIIFRLIKGGLITVKRGQNRI